MYNDEILFDLIDKELNRQKNSIELIASENIVSRNVLLAQGSVLTNKYAEGYPKKRYYGGCEFVDEIEQLAIDRVKLLFNAAFANVQPHSGSQANQAVFLGLLNPGDKILGMSLDAGGHLTHGSKVNMSGKWFESYSYGVSKDTGLIDMQEVERIAFETKPKLIIAGGSAYPRAIDFAGFAKIAKSVGAYFMVDMAHFAGLVAGKQMQNPMEFADVVTSTTHKTLRGPRGGLILTNNEEIAKAVNSAIFPGLQGGPLMHVIAGKAVAFGEALQPSFKEYAKQVILNAKALALRLQNNGYDIFTGGTDCHLMLVDLRSNNITGKEVEALLEEVGIACNKNSIPFDTQKPMITSGVRFGSPAGTTRGFKEAEFTMLGDLITKAIYAYKNQDNAVKNDVKSSILELCNSFPIC